MGLMVTQRLLAGRVSSSVTFLFSCVLVWGGGKNGGGGIFIALRLYNSLLHRISCSDSCYMPNTEAEWDKASVYRSTKLLQIFFSFCLSLVYSNYPSASPTFFFLTQFHYESRVGFELKSSHLSFSGLGGQPCSMTSKPSASFELSLVCVAF